MKQFIFSTGNLRGPFFLRLFLATVLFPHGAQKMFGWFGGFGFTETMAYFTNAQGLPWSVAFLIIVIEFVGPVALVLGFATRLWSIAILFLVTGIIVTSHSQYFFMNWFGNQPSEGMEYFLLMIGMTLSLSVSGAGRYSIDAILDRSRNPDRLNSMPELTSARA